MTSSHNLNEGMATPRAPAKQAINTPSSTSSYHTSYSTTSTPTRDLDEVEAGLGALSLEGSPNGVPGIRMGIRRREDMAC
jgi:hypothetical protein